MSEQEPELRWAFPPAKKSRRGRIWLIVILAVAAIAVGTLLVFFLVPRGGTPSPTYSPSTSPSPSASASVTPTPSATEPAEPAEPNAPVDTPPPVADPDLATFRGQVAPLLTDAETGLGFVAEATSAEESRSIVDELRDDAQRLAETAAPTSVYADWQESLVDYSTRLEDLRATTPASAGFRTALDAARQALRTLSAVAGG